MISAGFGASGIDPAMLSDIAADISTNSDKITANMMSLGSNKAETEMMISDLMESLSMNSDKAMENMMAIDTQS